MSSCYPNRHEVSATPSWQPFDFIRDRSMVSLSWGKNDYEGDDKACKKSFIVAIRNVLTRFRVGVIMSPAV